MVRKSEKLITTNKGLLWHYDFLFSDSFVEFLNLLPEAALISDNKGNILLSNMVAQRLFGFSRDEFLTCKVEDLVPDAIREVHPKLRKMFFEHPKPRFIESRDIELCASKKDGSVFPMESSLFAIKTDKGLLAVNLIRDITQQKLEQKKIESYAFVDSITNLPNRRYFDTAINHNLLNVSDKQAVGLLFVDVDKFKNINDNYGHSTGDMVLKVIAERLLKSVRGKDIVARIGGDEFIIMVYPLTDKSYLESIAQRILNVLQDEVIVSEHKLLIHVSIGITASSSLDTTSIDLINQADKAMYHAKNAGGNQFHTIF